MFDKILDLVKDHLNASPEVAAHVPDEKKDAVANEVATHLTTGLNNHEALEGGPGGLMSMLQNAISSGNPLTSAIEGGLVSSLASKFGLSPAATGAIAGALPGILQKFAHKAQDPDDPNISLDDINKTATQGGLDNLGGLFNK